MSRNSNETVLGQGRWLRLVNCDGWEYCERAVARGVVVVVAVTDDDRLILTEQYRPAVGKRVVDLPAGLAGDVEGQEDEAFAEAARRELEEETGYTAKTMRKLIACPSSAGITSEVITYFHAAGLTKSGEGGGDHSEEIEVLEVPLKALRDWLSAKDAAGIAVDPKIPAGLFFASKLLISGSKLD